MTTPTNDVRDQVVAALMNNDPSRRKAGEIDLITVTLEGVNAVVDLIRQEKIKVLEEVEKRLVIGWKKNSDVRDMAKLADTNTALIQLMIQQLKEEA